jgi:Periplasmic copper-binding protein (NosD)
MRMRSVVIGLSLAAIALGACTLNPPVAPADSTPACGSTLKANVTLTHDLVCAGTALTIAVEGITVNLNGHPLKGNGTGIGISTGGHAVAIRNGRITNFGRGVLANQGPNHGPTIVHVQFDHDQTGVLVDQVAGTRIRASSFTNNQTGISCGETVSHGAHDVFTTNTFSKNTFGVNLFKCSNVSVRDNGFSANVTGIYAYNTLFTCIESNRITGGTIGVNFQSRNQDAVITRNTITANTIGMRVSSGGGPLYNTPVSGNTISSNVMRNNGAAGLAIIIDATQLSVSNNVVIANVFDRNGFQPAGTTNSPLGTEPLNDGAYANVLNRDAAFTFSDNIATRNADYGIQAVAGIHDGGGNTASGNGNADQCLGLAC